MLKNKNSANGGVWGFYKIEDYSFEGVQYFVS